MNTGLRVYRDATPAEATTGNRVSENEDLLELYLLRYGKASTRRAYQNDLRSFFQQDTVLLSRCVETDFRHVNAHITEQELAGKAPATIRRKVAALRGFFGWLVALGVIPHNPADRHVTRRIEKVNRRDASMTVLTRQQANGLLASVDKGSYSGPRDYALLLTLLHCVLRRSEAAAMDIEHIHRVSGFWVLDLPSTKGGAVQYVKMPDMIHETISESLSMYGYSSGPVWRSLSNNSKGRRLSDRSIYRIVNKYASSAGIVETVGAHTLRHTGCTLAIEAGASVQQVQTHARHKNLETTMIYVHQRDKLANSAADYIHLDGKRTQAKGAANPEPDAG